MERVMSYLTSEIFIQWMESYGKASRENDAKASSELFSQDAEYYESPFTPPIVGRDAIYQYWYEGAQTLKDKETSFEVLSVSDHLGIARWQSQFTVIASGKRLALDCLFLVEFGEERLCSIFREWWHIQTVSTGQQESL